MATKTLSVRDQLVKLVDGYETGTPDGALKAGGLSVDGLTRLSKRYGVTVYLPGEYHGEDRVVITDSAYAYAVGTDGRIETIAG